MKRATAILTYGCEMELSIVNLISHNKRTTSQFGHVPAAKNQIKASSVSLCFFMVVLELNLGGVET